MPGFLVIKKVQKSETRLADEMTQAFPKYFSRYFLIMDLKLHII